MAAFLDDYSLVLPRPAHQLVAVALGEALKEHVELLALVLLVLLGRYFVLEVDELVEPADFLLLGDVVGKMLGSVGSGTLRVLEHEGGVVLHVTDQGHRLLEIVLRLVVIAYKDVSR